jgi:hypothetical protein
MSGYAAAQGAADTDEGTVESGCQGLHAGGGSESNQSNNEGIFDQVPTFVAAGQILELEVKMKSNVSAMVCLKHSRCLLLRLAWNPLQGRARFMTG